MEPNVDRAPRGATPRDTSTLTPNTISRDYVHQLIIPTSPSAHSLLPHLRDPQLQSAPNLLPISTAPLNSTPHKRKAALTGLHPPINNNVSAGKRRRVNDVATLIEQELAGAQHTCLDFVQRFLFPGSPNTATTVCAEQILSAIIATLKQSESKAGAVTEATTIGHGKQCRKFNQKHLYVCYPPTYTNKGYPQWFCRFANAIQQHASCPPTKTKLEWRVAKSKPLLGAYNNDIRPDFVLTWGGVPLEWRSILVVGEHQSMGSNVNESFIQLASYAEQVFIAQPFRVFVFGVLTSNAGPNLTFWRFDRSGAIGSVPLNYSTSNLDLLTVVSALVSISQMNARHMGFHVDSISWGDEHAYPLDHKSDITIQMFKPVLGNSLVTIDPPSEVVSEVAASEVAVSLKKLVFLAPGIVTRGTRIWTGALSSGEAIAIKYSWSNTQRALEGDLYQLASEKRVIGVATILCCTTYENVLTHLHAGGSPAADCNFTQPQAYKIHMQRQNRVLSRLVLSPTGRPLLDSRLSPLQVAEGLLGGLIGHASLFFQGGILHRDISPNNIIVIDDSLPQLTSVSSPAAANDLFAWIWPRDGTPLRGCLIDLDNAIEISAQPSGALDRTGTYPFMAIQILRGEEQHRYRHDLESFLYVLLWVCCYPAVAGSANIISSVRHIWPASDPLSRFHDGDEFLVACHKVACVISSSRIFGLLLERFRPGFEHFKRVAKEMRMTLWRLPGCKYICKLSEEGKPSEGVDGQHQEGSEGRGEEDEEEGEREWLLPEEVRLGVSNKDAFLEVKKSMQWLVATLKD
ncbi:hypothetical protein L211DRAFT_819181 [Terfezia boudieri ATCC MYA-4762]|uniref:Fungal-type protein kinase domain-containing protein n=1 Tax=Terfezia boudieri ATCC MYA-4762 TaxID=1051890 RepID=A0A3N4LWM0_9PEZI|nr:hypothetical protein L211DRAFT_819181 [Terfezia boudieri ATCC MYA-4762]